MFALFENLKQNTLIKTPRRVSATFCVYDLVRADVASLCEVNYCDPVHFFSSQAACFCQFICLMQRPTSGISGPWTKPGAFLGTAGLLLAWLHLQVCKISILSKLARST